MIVVPKRRQQQRRSGWQPLQRGPVNPDLLRVLRTMGSEGNVASYEAWANDRYDVLVRRRDDGSVHLSLKRRDRSPVRDWRHLQQIKNEILGPEEFAVEVFPPESQLVDTSNEYHLWHTPGMQFAAPSPRLVMSPEENRAANAALVTAVGSAGKGRQRAWEPGLTTGAPLPDLPPVAGAHLTVDLVRVWAEYLAESDHEGTDVSLADFALYLHHSLALDSTPVPPRKEVP